MTVMTMPELVTATRVLVDPEMPGVLAGAVVGAEAAVSLCMDRTTLLTQAGPGTVLVLADVHPLAVEVLVRRGCEVVAVATTGGPRAESWLREVVEAGAVAALVTPDVPALQGALRLACA